MLHFSSWDMCLSRYWIKGWSYLSVFFQLKSTNAILKRLRIPPFLSAPKDEVSFSISSNCSAVVHSIFVTKTKYVARKVKNLT